MTQPYKRATHLDYTFFNNLDPEGQDYYEEFTIGYEDGSIRCFRSTNDQPPVEISEDLNKENVWRRLEKYGVKVT